MVRANNAPIPGNCPGTRDIIAPSGRRERIRKKAPYVSAPNAIPRAAKAQKTEKGRRERHAESAPLNARTASIASAMSVRSSSNFNGSVQLLDGFLENLGELVGPNPDTIDDT